MAPSTSRLAQAVVGLLLFQVPLSFSSPTTPQEPCALVAAAQKKRLESSSVKQFTVTAELATLCLNSVPFNSKRAVEYLDALDYYFDWQSTKKWLKNPPQGYMSPSTDLDGRLKKIRNKASRNKYTGEYQFQMEVEKLIRSAYDGHFTAPMDLLSIFKFERDQVGPLVSLSDNGRDLPKVYLLYDVRKKINEISAIQTIDGEIAAKWLNKLSKEDYTSHDPDARHNGLYYNIPRGVSGYSGTFLKSGVLNPGNKITIGFENGTTKEFENSATSSADWTAVTDGPSFYNKFCGGESAPLTSRAISEFNETAPSLHEQELPIDTPYNTFATRNTGGSDLKPVVKSSSDEMFGYFLENSNVAVLRLTSFDAKKNRYLIENYSHSITKFLTECRKAGKEKLIVDVSGNGGGIGFLGFDTFIQIAPNGKLQSPIEIAATEQFDLLGGTINRLLADDTLPKAMAARFEKDKLFDINSYVDNNGQKFKSWKEFFGPRDGFTNLFNWDFNNLKASGSVGGLVITGHGSRAPVAPLFQKENIVLVTDGICASTCAILADLMRRHGIKSIAVGGRPKRGPMQAVGGVKGEQVISFGNLFFKAKQVYDNFLTPEEKKQHENSRLAMMATKGNAVLNRLPNFGDDSIINYRNKVYAEDQSRTPRQFVNEPADCKIWRTKDAIFDKNKWWTTIADSWWGNKDICIEGSRPSSG
ncbi:hypothetical protein LOZ39_000967 [Ophidiomyces ophidiicola]|nr:hypothetical protein LOZ64_003831 [Ophidiomyces ophidiicola]KAI2008409.1 hypothetical protein LOZ50_002109 [Ophidiomyces ophidiicola]KAI2010939.1 hypothetical protein LOZ49_003299 [Ophidiomyces ophidiicola]KAI2020256.1 hypothetical protein LOZ46_002899 [Ophidiomyces ophidiicola]KAI2036209.1 hypothetical protein LOZ45_000216 [Ophidiomyces ophidiicola]